MAQRIANHVADVIFPAKVLIKRDNEVTINRGEGPARGCGRHIQRVCLGRGN